MAHNYLNGVNKAGCTTTMDCSKMSLQVGAVGVEFDCALDCLCRMEGECCNESHTKFGCCAYGMVVDKEMIHLAG